MCDTGAGFSQAFWEAISNYECLHEGTSHFVQLGLPFAEAGDFGGVGLSCISVPMLAWAVRSHMMLEKYPLQPAALGLLYER